MASNKPCDTIMLALTTVFVTFMFVAIAFATMSPPSGGYQSQANANNPLHQLMRRSAAKPNDHHSMMHNHLSRKVLERACAASKDTIDEIVACLTNNETLMKSVQRETAAQCYKSAFNEEFDEKAVQKHKELICNNRDKFETMTTCIYKKTGENMDSKEMEKLTETLVDVGLCIINALDG